MKKTVIDLFCGAGGTTTGVHNSKIAEVIACINHDSMAIKSHAQNYPNCKHYTEDIRLFNEKLLPQCDILTVSAECTHFSIAKGGESRNADSRTLSEELYRYIAHCNPTFVVVENVKEFKTWSELVQKKDKQGNLVFKSNGEAFMIPDTDKNNEGVLYRKWVQTIKNMGYDYKSTVLNSADFGAYTSRERYFGIFAKRGNAILFPQPTHAKSPKENTLQKWKAVSDVLQLDNKGESIFSREKPLCENTLKRLYAGLQKFVPKNESEWIVKYLSNNPLTGVNSGTSITEPLHTICTQNRLGIASVQFLNKYYGIANCQAIDKPCDTITTVDRFALVTPVFLEKAYSNCVGQSIDRPCDTITNVPKFSLVSAAYSLDKIAVKANDSHYTRLIKEFCREHNISDIFMRMLDVDKELKVIQGFPKDYVLLGTQTQRKKFVGNSVVPVVMEKIIKKIAKL